MAGASPQYAFRKPRKNNFTDEEVNLLVKLATKNYKYLSAKGTDPLAYHKKRIWNEITKAINSLGVEHRTLTEIKNKWKKCRTAKKKFICK